MYVYNNVLVNEKFCCYLRVFVWWKVAIIKEHNQWCLTMTNRQYNFFFPFIKTTVDLEWREYYVWTNNEDHGGGVMTCDKCFVVTVQYSTPHFAPFVFNSHCLQLQPRPPHFVCPNHGKTSWCLCLLQSMNFYATYFILIS